MKEPERSEEPKSELLERFRKSGLRLDREGRFWHEGELIQHPGLQRALHRWIDLLEDGRPIIRLDAERYCFLEVEDAPFSVMTVELERAADGVHVQLLLSDGTGEELEYTTLRVGADNALYCRVKGRFEARFTRQAYYLLGELVEELQGAFGLRAAGELWLIGSR